MEQLHQLLDDLNSEVYNPVGLNILWPRNFAFLYVCVLPSSMAVWIYWCRIFSISARDWVLRECLLVWQSCRANHSDDSKLLHSLYHPRLSLHQDNTYILLYPYVLDSYFCSCVCLAAYATLLIFNGGTLSLRSVIQRWTPCFACVRLQVSSCLQSGPPQNPGGCVQSGYRCCCRAMGR